MKKIVFCLAAVISGCVSQPTVKAYAINDDTHAISMSKSRILGGLKDPDSAKFRNVTVHRAENGDYVVCGEVNAKNSYGGYVGFTRFAGYPEYMSGIALQGGWEFASYKSVCGW